MQLLFLIQRNRWFIEYADIWYRVGGDQHLKLVQSILAVKCIDEYELPDQPVQGGRVEISVISEGEVIVSLLSKSNELVVEKPLKVESSLLGIINWTSRPYADSWVESRVKLDTENVTRLELQVFLPEISGSASKVLEVVDNDDNKLQYTLVRGEQTRCTLVDQEVPGDYNFYISCEPEPCLDTSDERSLGFVLANTVLTV